jgi:hypothetical protein
MLLKNFNDTRALPQQTAPPGAAMVKVENDCHTRLMA